MNTFIRFIGFLSATLLPCFTASAQQNLFNIPSSDITPKAKVFYQHQLNIYQNKLESKAHFVYGLGKNWDAGLNLVGKGFYFDPQWQMLYNDSPIKGALFPVLMGTLQKQWKIGKHWYINAGTQAGFNLSNQFQKKEFVYFNYGLLTYHFGKHNKITGGVYKTNQLYVGSKQTEGVMLGYEIQLNKRFSLMGDWVSGRNDASVAVLGGFFNMSKHVQLCAGWQIPNPKTPKPMAFVFEFNWLGWNVFE